MPIVDLPPDLLTETTDALKARVAHGKRVTDFDWKVAERLYKSRNWPAPTKSPLGRRVVGDILKTVEAKVNDKIKKIITDPNPTASVDEERGRANGIAHIITTDPAEPLYTVIHEIVRMTFPPASGVKDNDFVRRRTINCLVALRNFQKTSAT